MNPVQIAQLILTILMALRQAIGAASELSTILKSDPDALKVIRDALEKETQAALADLEKAINNGV